MNVPPCPRCEAASLEVDDVEGFLLCPSCGYVAEEQLLVNQQAFDEETGFGGVLVAVHDDGTAAAGAAGTGGAWSGGVGRGQRDHRARALKLMLDKLQAAASRLSFAGRHLEEAQHMLRELYQNRLVQLAGVPHGVDAFCAAVLLSVARANQLPVSLTDAAAAAQVPKAAAAAMYRSLSALSSSQQGGPAPIMRPSQSLRALTLKQAAAVLRAEPATQQRGRKRQKTAAGATPSDGSVAADTVAASGSNWLPADGTSGASGMQVVSSETDLRAHPYVNTCLQLADLVSKAGMGEGRSPPIVAASILLLAAGAPGMQGVGHITASGLAPIAGCTRQALAASKHLLGEQLLQLAALLPMGGVINASNLAAYLPLVIAATHTIIALMRRAAAGAPPQAAAVQLAPSSEPLLSLGLGEEEVMFLWIARAVRQDRPGITVTCCRCT